MGLEGIRENFELVLDNTQIGIGNLFKEIIRKKNYFY